MGRESAALGFLLILLAVASGGPAHGGKALSLAELVELARRAGFPDPELAAAVAYSESTGRPWATGDNGQSLGLWQIHWTDHRNLDRWRLLEPTYNATAALQVSKQGADWQPWTCYRNGSYRKWLPPARR